MQLERSGADRSQGPGCICTPKYRVREDDNSIISAVSNPTTFPLSSPHYATAIHSPQSPNGPPGYPGSKLGHHRAMSLIDTISSPDDVGGNSEARGPFMQYNIHRQPPEHMYHAQGQTMTLGNKLDHTRNRLNSIQDRPASSGMLMPVSGGSQSISRLGGYPEDFVKIEINSDQRVVDTTSSQRDMFSRNDGQNLQPTNKQTRTDDPVEESCCSTKSVNSPLEGQYFPPPESFGPTASTFGGTGTNHPNVSMGTWSSFGDQILGNGYALARNIQNNDLQDYMAGGTFQPYPYTPINSITHAKNPQEFINLSPNPSGGDTFANFKDHCNCGQGCTCFGCSEHPNNVTTTNRVQELTSIMIHDESQIQQGPDFERFLNPTELNSFDTPINNYTSAAGSHKSSLSLDYDSLPSPTLSSPLQSTRDFNVGPSSHENYLMQDFNDPAQYVTAQFDLGGTSACSDPSACCTCDSDCACPNCLTHSVRSGNGINMPLDRGFTPNQTGASVNTNTRYDQISHTRQEGRL